MSVRLSHLGICVRDLTASLRFWCDGLGFTVAEGYDLTDAMIPGLAEALEVPSPISMRSQMIKRDDLKIEVISYTEPLVTGTPSVSRGALGFTHLSFLTPDIDSFAQHLLSCGGTLLPDTRRNVGIEVVFLADPDGTRVELMQG